MYCEKCKEYDYGRRPHQCPPIYEVRFPDSGTDDWHKINANSPEEALEKICKKQDVDSADYWIIGNGGVENVEVRREGWSDIKIYNVSAETEIVYTARLIVKKKN